MLIALARVLQESAGFPICTTSALLLPQTLQDLSLVQAPKRTGLELRAHGELPAQLKSPLSALRLEA